MNNNNPTNESINNSTENNNENKNQPATDFIPTAVVIKNIPFAIKKEQMLQYIESLNLPLPYAFNYHFDNGVFRGLAFANFNNLKDTNLIIQNLNGKVMNGRKLRVEYKKVQQSSQQANESTNLERNTSNMSLSSMASSAANGLMSHGNNSFINQQSHQQQQQDLQSHHSSSYNLGYQYTQQNYQPETSNLVRYHAPMVQKQTYLQPSQPSLDFNDPEVLEIYTQLILFKDRSSKYSEISWQQQYLTPQYKRIINSLCSFLNLYEISDPVYLSVRRQNQPTQLNSNIAANSPSQGFASTAMYQQAPLSTGGSIYSQHLQNQQQPQQQQQQHNLLQNGMQDESSYLIKPPQGIFPPRNITPAAPSMSYLQGLTNSGSLEKEPQVITTSHALNYNNINLTNPLLRSSQQQNQSLRPQLTNTPSTSSILLQQQQQQQPPPGLNVQLQPQTTSGSMQSATSLHSISSSITQSMIGLSLPTTQQQQQQRYKQHPLLQRAQQQNQSQQQQQYSGSDVSFTL